MDSARTLVQQRVRESVAATEYLLTEDGLSFVLETADVLVSTLRKGGTVLFCGNGGSAVDATHLAAELLGRFMLERAALPALSLADNTAALSAIGNDYGYQHTFSRQIRGLGRSGDALVALSTSGNSENVVAAVDVAREANIRTIGMTGRSGGKLAQLADICLCVDSTETARIQEVHMVAGHTVCELVESALSSAS